MYRVLWFFYLVVSPVVLGSWSDDEVQAQRAPPRGRFHVSKRHMVQGSMRAPGQKRPLSREGRKKPSGHLTPLEEDDMDNEEVVSVAINPPPVRRIDKIARKPARLDKQKPTNQDTAVASSSAAAELLKNVLIQLGKEFMLKQTDENFVFGQYVSGTMRNMTTNMRIKMQHDILDLIVKYQKARFGLGNETVATAVTVKVDKKANDTDELDFSSLSKFVG
ncbi:uncharacterized protein LOC105389655 [Plutella xylostella]|uniref:uncharacterized protein LOC105389655 n=1 Tax=Plutella xylostella TaxID=51655 RepID=UPI0020325BD8|nr:uncharacterized protein LOC105389655 [Plutella xylostella]